MNELVEKFNDMNVTYILSENRDDMYLDVETIAEVFNTSRQNISYHLGELELSETFANNICKSQITLYSTNGRPKKLYNLDVVIEIGYRVKSPQAREFRNWANNILKKYLMAPAKPGMLDRLANAMHIDTIEVLEENNELKSQVRSLSRRLGRERALEKENFALKDELKLANKEIADVYGELNTLKGNYWKRKLEKVQDFVNRSLDEWK